MSGNNFKGKLDLSSVLDDHDRNANVVADETHSSWPAAYNPQKPVHTFMADYSALPSPPMHRREQITTAAPSTGPQTGVALFGEPLENAAAPLNMQLQNTIASQRMMVRGCVKTKLFRRLKFFKKDVHGLYDLRQGSVCAFIVAHCNVTPAEASEHWWADMRKLVVCTHTDRRNNVIKNMRLRFRGKCTSDKSLY
jgi:hypothetical protein